MSVVNCRIDKSFVQPEKREKKGEKCERRLFILCDGWKTLVWVGENSEENHMSQYELKVPTRTQCSLKTLFTRNNAYNTTDKIYSSLEKQINAQHDAKFNV